MSICICIGRSLGLCLPTLREIEIAAGYLRDANQLFAQRFGYSTVAHSIALTAYATSIASSDHKLVGFIVAFFGLYFARIQFVITFPLSKKIDALRDKYLQHDRIYMVYKRTSDGDQSVEVPIMLGAMWAGLILYLAQPKLVKLHELQIL